MREEVLTIERYIDIVKIQLEERLHFSMDIPPNLFDFLVPPMMLQMLVENSIKHGLDNLRHGGRLRITGSEDADHVIFSIKNDCAEGNEKLRSSMGIGLANIKKRLTLLYSDQASLDVTTAEGEFTVQVRIPKDVNL